MQKKNPQCLQNCLDDFNVLFGNKIITNFMDNGNSYPAIGLSFGLEPIFVILKSEMEKTRLLDIYMVPLDTNIEVLKLASLFRSNGHKVLIEMNKKKIGKCFEYAERENIKYVRLSLRLKTI